MVEGQHRGLYKLGKHRGRYEALRPAKPVGVHRIPAGFTYADIDELASLPIDVGMHGTNFHGAHKEYEAGTIGRYSAGCQVALLFAEYLIALEICKGGFKSWGPTLTYTLLNTNDFQ